MPGRSGPCGGVRGATSRYNHLAEDIWTEEELGFAYDDDPVGDLIDECDILVNIAASPYHGQTSSNAGGYYKDLARDVADTVVCVNQVGGRMNLTTMVDRQFILPDGTCAGTLPAPRICVDD